MLICRFGIDEKYNQKKEKCPIPDAASERI